MITVLYKKTPTNIIDNKYIIAEVNICGNEFVWQITTRWGFVDVFLRIPKLLLRYQGSRDEHKQSQGST